jgi:hypothetical protein
MGCEAGSLTNKQGPQIRPFYSSKTSMLHNFFALLGNSSREDDHVDPF